MWINAAKTGLMLVSAASSFQARVRIDLDGQTITGQDNMKILGVTLVSDASFKTHVTNLASRLRARTWALSRLKKKGLKKDQLVRIYKCLIRPTVEYAAPAWHSSLTAAQAAYLERQQVQALKNIFGTGLSANKMRDRANVELLSKRRENAITKFARKCLVNPRCQAWFKKRRESNYPHRSSVTYPDRPP